MKRLIGVISLCMFLFLNCSDYPHSTAKILLGADVSVTSSQPVTFLIQAIVFDEEIETRLNGVEVHFLCAQCSFILENETMENIIGEPTQNELRKRTDSQGVAEVWVVVEPDTEGVVSALLENGMSDQIELTVTSPK